MKTVFILEDEAGIREVLKLLLESENYKVHSFADVSEFNSRDMEYQPDLFLLDVMLPDGLGTEVCQQIKNHAETSHIPVIIMSAHAKAVETEKACSADDFISKPFDLNDVLGKVERFTSHNSKSFAV